MQTENGQKHFSHDAFFKTIFSDPAQAADLLRYALPSEAVASLDLDRLEPLPESFVDCLGGEGRADLLFLCPICGANNGLLIAVLFEHKSYPDRDVLVQMARYWVNLVLKEQDRPVLPILFYHGPSLWEPPDFSHRYPFLPEVLRRYQPSFPVVFIDMARKEDAGIWGHPDLDAKTKLGLIILKHIFDTELEVAAPLAHALSLMPEQERMELLKLAYLYLFHKGKKTHQSLEKAMDHLPEAQKMPFQTWSESFFEQGKQAGMLEGKAELVSQMLSNGADWDLVTRLTGITPEELAAKQ